MTENIKKEKDIDDKKLEKIEDKPSMEDQIKAAVDVELAKIKDNLDKAYGERDELKAEMKKRDDTIRSAELKTLEEAGKHKEVYDIKLKSLEDELKSLRGRNTELSRDNAVRSSLSTLELKNDKASEMAFNDVIKSLVQNANGNWVHSSGIEIDQAVKNYSTDEANAFLFNVKSNSGSGTKPSEIAGEVPTDTKALKDMSMDEVIKAAGDGKIKPLGEWV